MEPGHPKKEQSRGVKTMWPLYPFADPDDMNSELFPFVRIVRGERRSEGRAKDI